MRTSANGSRVIHRPRRAGPLRVHHGGMPSTSARQRAPRTRLPPASAAGVLSGLRPRPIPPLTSPLEPGEAEILRLRWLDARLLVAVLGMDVPRDLLASSRGRMRILIHLVPVHGVLTGRAALWVHVGGAPPQEVCVNVPARMGVPPGAVVRRAAIDRSDIVTIAGRRCTSLARSAVDVARTATARCAVDAILAAYHAGQTRQSLQMALSHCRGACAWGRPRVQRLIDDLVDLGEAGRSRGDGAIIAACAQPAPATSSEAPRPSQRDQT